MQCNTENVVRPEAFRSCPRNVQVRSVMELESTGSGDFLQSESVVDSMDPTSCIEPITPVDTVTLEVTAAPELEVIPIAPDDSKPYVGREFESEEAAIDFYNAYAKICGFSVRLNQVKKSQKLKVVVFRAMSCSKEGKREKKFLENTDRKRAPKPITRIGCPARLEVRREAENKWVVSKFIEKHCHDLMATEHDFEMPKFVRQNELRRLFKRFINAALKSELTFAFAMERITRLTEELKEMSKEETPVGGHNATPIEQASTSCGQLPVCSDGVCIDFRSGLALPSSDFMFHDLNVIQNHACYANKRFKCSKEIDIGGRVGPDSPFVEGTWMLN